MTDSPDFVVSTAEFDLLYGDLELGRVPFPLDVPSIGATVEQRVELTGEMYRGLADRGLAAGHRVDAGLERLLRLLSRHDVSVDAVGHIQQPLRAVAATDGRDGVLGEVVADQVWLTEIRPTALAMAIVGVLPANEPGPVRAMSVPYQPLAQVVSSDDDDFGDDPFGGDLDDQTALTRAGLPAQDAAALTELASGRVAGGQFGVSHGSSRISTLVTWFDTYQGRYLMVSENSWLSIAPADNKRIENRVGDVLSTVVSRN
jgi:hypothetical protein